DNGRGFDTKSKHKGNGLKNLPIRLSKIGGRYNIQSSLGKGTIVTIGLRLSPLTKTTAAGEPS
ncbi:MAG TPA: sensor histidine kinase, partial [Verrucomicrobiae bacterium]